MGAWEAGSFGNDDALDWSNDFSDDPSTELVEKTLKLVTDIGDEYLEAPERSMVIAAAEVVAALKGAPHPKLPQEIRGCE